MKTPKTKSLKLNTGKTANGETPTPAKKSKAKTPKTKERKETPPKPEMSAAELKLKREKEGTFPTVRTLESHTADTIFLVLFFRHRLQKGFLSTSEPPQDTEMAKMSEYFTQLEALDDLEQSVIRTTKIHKVLKAILKLSSIPMDEEYNFKSRSTALLTTWQKVLNDGAEAGAEDGDKTEVAAAEEPAAGEEKAEDVEMKDEEAEEAKEVVEAEPADAPVEPSTEMGNDAQDEADNAPAAKAEVPSEVPATTDGEPETSGQEVAAANNLL